MAHMQMEVEKYPKKKSPIAEIVSYSYTTAYCGLHERNTRECIHSRQWYN